jgi:cysteine desulfurase/selenocysteine lyase
LLKLASDLDVEAIRKDFPILRRRIRGKSLAYLDNAATTQKPKKVIETLDRFYRNTNANIHRAIHTLGEESTLAYEQTRDKVASLINAPHREEVIFVRNATEAINLVAQSWGRANIRRGDHILTTIMEHHSNLVPWQILAQQKGAKLEYLGIDDEGRLDLEDALSKLPGSKLLALSHASNVLGTINPVKDLIRAAHKNGCLVMLDAAQSVPHMKVDVSELDCDFMAFSAHKMLGPTGVGILYGKKVLLEAMPPFLTGGDMIREVHLDGAKWNELPWKYEAGTSNIADVVAFGAAVDYLNSYGYGAIRQHDDRLLAHALESFQNLKDIQVYGPSVGKDRTAVVSFNLNGVHPHDIASLLDADGIAIRSGHHCAQPLMERLGINGAARASFYLYNTEEEVDRLISSLKKIREEFAI